MHPVMIVTPEINRKKRPTLLLSITKNDRKLAARPTAVVPTQTASAQIVHVSVYTHML